MFERLIFNQVYEYFCSNDLLSKCQSGFRPLHSTVTALLEAVNEWTQNIGGGLINSVVFLDLAKAFDTVDHGILVEKLALYGIRGTTLNWFKSYLNNRTQKCNLNGHLSSTRSLSCGVPQGTILGPLLFLIYINDLPNCLGTSSPRMYADDTNITYPGNSIHEIELNLNKELANVRDWLLANKLSLNAAKTEYMLIASKYRLKNIHRNPQLKINSKSISRVNKSKSVGVMVDENLTWSEHINTIAKKVSSAIAGLRQIRPSVTFDTLVTIYKSLILPFFDYCDVLWTNANKGGLDRLQKLQNRAARVITHASYDVRSRDLLKSLNWDNLIERRFKHERILMHKIMNDRAPQYLKSHFSRVRDSNHYDLRG